MFRRFRHRSLTLAPAFALLLLTAAAKANTVPSSVLTGPFEGVTVLEGSDCTLDGAMVTGNVNTIANNLTIINNRTAVRPASNEIFGSLICVGNDPLPFVHGNPNAVHSNRVGQCAGI